MFVFTLRLHELALWNFRNYRSLHLRLEGDLFLFLGANAQGKTNLLEAIGLLVTGRSPRTAHARDLIRWGEEAGGVRGRGSRSGVAVDVEVRLEASGNRTVLVHGKPVRRASEMLGEIRAVFFFPEDLQLVKGSPALRRRFLDVQLSQLSPLYRDRLIAYQRVLRQRNAFLGRGFSGLQLEEGLRLWDEQLVAIGAHLMHERAAAVRRLSREAAQAHARISGGSEHLLLTYRPFWNPEPSGEDHGSWGLEDWRAALQEALGRWRSEEVRRRTTLVGPQRDDVDIWLDGRPARSFASQGQQRSIVLACKMAEVEHLRDDAGEYPLLLLDDVFSELDERRRQSLLQAVVPAAQTFLTAADPGIYPRGKGVEARVFFVEAGNLRSADAPGFYRLS